MKTIFLDCDGTLTDYYEFMSESTKLACKLAKEKGHVLVLCTGRSRCTITKDCLDLPISGIIAANGGYIEYDGKVIQNNPIDDNLAHEIIQRLLDNKRPFFLEANYTTVSNKELDNWLHLDFDDYDNDVPELTKTFMKRAKLLDDVFIKDINKITFVLSKDESIDYYKEKYSSLDSNLVFPNESKQRFADITVKNINKGFGIKEYQRLTQTKREDCFALGDWDNDAIMFDECKEGIAMGNGSLTIKQKATYITTDVDKDGVYNAFKHFNLI